MPMEQKLTVEDARKSLVDHVAEKGIQIYAKYGPCIGWNELLQILEDRSCVRYPCEVVFDAKPLVEGEFAAALAKGEDPNDGFTIFVHPFFSQHREEVPYLVLYHLVVVNYGDFASSDDAETFGAAAFGMLKEEYYQKLCGMADQL